MASVYLHIGLPKTGTTALQHFLSDNRAALEKHGVCFPDFGLHYTRVNPYRNGHFLVPYFYGTESPQYDSSLDQLAEIGKRFERIILTDESLWRAGERQPKLWEKLRDDLAKRGLKLCVITYLRRQDNFILSFYRQRIKGFHTSLPFYDYLDELREMYPLDYYAYMNMLSGALGRENLFIRVYEKGQFHGAEQTLHSDFLDLFGLSLEDGFAIQKEELNEALDDSHLELRRLLNSISDEHTLDPLLKQSLKANARNSLHNSSVKTSFFHPGDQTAYLESFAETNRRLAKEYLGREDGVLFYDESGKELPEYQVDTEALLQETIRFFARTIRTLELEIEELKKPIPQRLKEKARHALGKDAPAKQQ